jgi:hypothetical protein
MKTEKGIPILNDNHDIEKLYLSILSNAFREMTNSLVEMEIQDANPKDMMEKCVWPILHEAGRRVSTILSGDLDVPEGGFEFVVG